jgi:hypothetical protein
VCYAFAVIYTTYYLVILMIICVRKLDNDLLLRLMLYRYMGFFVDNLDAKEEAASAIAIRCNPMKTPAMPTGPPQNKTKYYWVSFVEIHEHTQLKYLMTARDPGRLPGPNSSWPADVPATGGTRGGKIRLARSQISNELFQDTRLRAEAACRSYFVGALPVCGAECSM